jgi:nucleoside 2-deoxyribosyltransferase
MKVYLAHNFAAREWLKEFVIPYIEDYGHKVTSSWITDDRHLTPSYKTQSAVVDLQEIEEAGAIVFFADQFGFTPGEGKFVELGYAIRAGKIVIVVGGKDKRCVFYNLNIVRHADNLEEVIPFLGGDLTTYGGSQENTL